MDLSRELQTATQRQAERYRVLGDVHGTLGGVPVARTRVLDISDTGMLVKVHGGLRQLGRLEIGAVMPIEVAVGSERHDCGAGRVVRLGQSALDGIGSSCTLALTFERNQTSLVRWLGQQCGVLPEYAASDASATPDVFAKRCVSDAVPLRGGPRLGRWVIGVSRAEGYSWPSAVESEMDDGAESTLPDASAVVAKANAIRCFDSSDYLGLSQHPEVQQILAGMGVGLGSWEYEQRQLEEALAVYHGRRAALTFAAAEGPMAWSAATLAGDEDVVLYARQGRAQEGTGAVSHSGRPAWDRLFDQQNAATLRTMLRRSARPNGGVLVVARGVQPEDGQVAPLRELAQVCAQSRARLLLDDAHGIGVLGVQGRGLEELYRLESGAVGLLAGSLGHAFGVLGSYIVGDASVIGYLREALPQQAFGHGLPATVAAAARRALQLACEETQLRDRLWRNVYHLASALQDTGFIVSEPQCPIVTVFVGAFEVLGEVSQCLSEAGIRCDAIARQCGIRRDHYLRISLTASHSAEDLSVLSDTLIRVFRQADLLGRSQEEVREIGERLVDPQTGVHRSSRRPSS